MNHQFVIPGHPVNTHAHTHTHAYTRIIMIRFDSPCTHSSNSATVCPSAQVRAILCTHTRERVILFSCACAAQVHVHAEPIHIRRDSDLMRCETSCVYLTCEITVGDRCPELLFRCGEMVDPIRRGLGRDTEECIETARSYTHARTRTRTRITSVLSLFNVRREPALSSVAIIADKEIQSIPLR